MAKTRHSVIITRCTAQTTAGPLILRAVLPMLRRFCALNTGAPAILWEPGGFLVQNCFCPSMPIIKGHLSNPDWFRQSQFSVDPDIVSWVKFVNRSYLESLFCHSFGPKAALLTKNGLTDNALKGSGGQLSVVKGAWKRLNVSINRLFPVTLQD